MHEHAICGVNGGSRRHAGVMPRLQRKAVLLQDDGQRNDGLHEGKLIPHALARAPAEWNVSAHPPRTPLMVKLHCSGGKV